MNRRSTGNRSNRNKGRRGNSASRQSTGGALLRQNDTITLRGSDILCTLYQQPATTPQAIINNLTNYLAIRPSVLADRVANMGALYSKYKLVKLRFIYKSNLASTFSGSLALGVLDDAPLSNYTGNIQTFDQVVNLRRSQDSNVWRDFSLTWQSLEPSTWFDTNTSGSDVRFTTPATLFASVSVNTGGPATGTIIGTVRLEYLIQFSGAIPVILPSLRNLIEDIGNRKSIVVNDQDGKEEPFPARGKTHSRNEESGHTAASCCCSHPALT